MIDHSFSKSRREDLTAPRSARLADVMLSHIQQFKSYVPQFSKLMSRHIFDDGSRHSIMTGLKFESFGTPTLD
jgi:hypothetical protein